MKLLGHSNAAEETSVPSCADGKLGGVPEYWELCDLIARTDLDEKEQERVDFKPKGKKAAPNKAPETKTFTDQQGQYLAFIFWSTRINRCPAQTDIQRFFGVSAPAVQQMIVTLEKLGFLTRTSGQARAIQVTLDQSQLPALEEPATPMVSPGRG